LLAVAPGAGAETFKAETTEQFEEDVAKANANATANTIVVAGGVSILPLKTETFTNKSGVQTVEGSTTQPGTKLEGTAVEPFPSELFVLTEGVSLTLKNVLVSHSGGSGVPAIESLTGSTLTLEGSTVAGNKSIGVIVEPGSTANVKNSTISDQAAGGMVDNGTASFFSSTVAFNKGVGVENKGTLNLSNTIVAENTAEQCVGKANTQDHSLDSDGTCGVEKSKVNPLLTELFNDGGGTPVHSLKPGSPAIKAGNEATCLKTSQEGLPRPGIPGGPCDIGADEYNETLPTIEVPANIIAPATSSEGAVVTFTPKATAPGGAIHSLTCTPESGSKFPIGPTTVECTAIDGHENKAKGSFKVTVGAPVEVTAAASPIAQTTATLNATVNPDGVTVSECKFEWGTTTAYGSTASCASLPGSGTSPVAVSAAITGLVNKTLYHFRISATTAGGATTGGDRTFRATAPHVYKNGVLGAEGKKVRTISWGTVKFSNATLGEVECHTVSAGFLENPTGGGSAVGQTQGFDDYECVSSSCTAQGGKGIEVTAENLPWSAEATEPEEGVLRAKNGNKTKTAAAAFQRINCIGVRNTQFAGENTPKFLNNGLSIGAFPDEEEFDAPGSGELESEAIGGTKIAGKLKTDGFAAQELIEIKNP
jgi:hypothetical protein